jgi:hypothetical protein
VNFSSRDYDAKEALYIMDHKGIAENVIREFLINQFNDMDINVIMNDDVDCLDLSDEDWDKVQDAIESAKVAVAVQL